MEYKGYAARVEFDPEAGVLFGEVEGLRDVVTFEATDVKGVERAFRESVDDYLALCAEREEEPEKPYSGKFLLRVEPRLHRDLAMAAAREGKSLNAFASLVFRTWIERGRTNWRNQEPEAQSTPANATSAQSVGAYGAQGPQTGVAENMPGWVVARPRTPGRLTPDTPTSSQTPQHESADRKVA